VNPNEVLVGAKSVIVLAAAYRAESEGKKSEGRALIARYAQHTDYHDVLAPRLKELTHFVNQVGGPESKSLWYVDTGPLLERDLAQRAGIGFAGKHTNLISRSLGNWFFIAEIITTLELPPDEPEKNRCGNCTRCIKACPTQAITGPFQLDARRCISYLTIELKGSIPEEFRAAIGNRIYGCDICLEVCPWNRFAKEGAIMREHERANLDQPALLELLSLDEPAFKQRFAGTPLLRTKRRGVLRNVCVALGNVGDEKALAALEKATMDHEALIAEHARWAIEQIAKRARETEVTA
jgi:epoxyqueuosine reductase